MKKLWIGVFAGFTLLALAPNAWATGWLRKAFAGIDPRCVIACLGEVEEENGQCKPKDKLECQNGCHFAPPLKVVIGGNTLDYDELALRFPGKWEHEIETIVAGYERSIGTNPESTDLYVVTAKNNPFEDFGINIPNVLSVVTPLNISEIINPDEDTETTAYSLNIKCNFSKNVTLFDGTKALGCRETRRTGANGGTPDTKSWGGQGCTVSDGCCNAGSGTATCSVNGGVADGAY